MILTSSVASAGIAVFITNFVWEHKYTKLELTVERDKSAQLAKIQADQVTAFEKVISDYNATVTQVAAIIEARDAQVEASGQKYRNLYAAYSRLQKAAPSDVNCRIDSSRADLLMQSVDEANSVRSRLLPAEAKKGKGTN